MTFTPAILFVGNPGAVSRIVEDAGQQMQVIQLPSMAPEEISLRQRIDNPTCVIFETQGLSEDEIEPFHDTLRSRISILETIILSGSDNGLRIARLAMRLNAFDCVPPEADEVRDSIRRAIAQLNSRLPMVRRLALLTPREREFFRYMLLGESIKNLSNRFNVSIQTAAKHRARVLNKLEEENEVVLLRRYGTWYREPLQANPVIGPTSLFAQGESA